VLPGSFLRARAIGLMPMIDQVKDLSYLPVWFLTVVPYLKVTLTRN
jgi:hypothetical protein